MHANEFNTLAALYELYNYAFKYNDQLIQALEEDEFSSKQRLAYKLEQVGFEKIINRHEMFFFFLQDLASTYVLSDYFVDLFWKKKDKFTWNV